jgi:hypothetical protein
MRMRLRYALAALACSVVLGSAAFSTSAQQLTTDIKYATGQNVVPVFEGWIPNADGTFSMVFGYFNRNWEEEPIVPVGPDNNIEPGGPDRGQPTYFLPRRRRSLFKVQVPKDWGKQDLVWTLTVNGRTEKVYGSLLAVEEINERMFMAGGGLSPVESDGNQPPSMKFDPVAPVTLPRSLTLTASVSDDGLPKPPPPPKPSPDGVIRQTNTVSNRFRGLTVTFFQYRGPAKVTFDSADPIRVTDGKIAVTARFTQPGTYWLRAVANDGRLSTPADVTVTVSAASSARLLPWFGLLDRLQFLLG